MKKALLPFSTILVFLCALLFVGITQQSAKGSTGYVGVDTCKGCHEAYYDSYSRSVHSKKAIPGSPANREACESCHGEGAEHVEKGGGKGTGIFAFSKKDCAEARTAKCLDCHEETRALAFWKSGKHKTEDVACDNCHSIHSGGEKFLKAGRSEVCFQCHRDIKTMVRKQSHHPIFEDKVACVDCHNPHGELSEKMIKADSINDLCYKCHAEKRGPYMNEHPPVEENCLNCHNPHGSNHDRLLTERVPVLCEECHENGGSMGGKPFTRFATNAPGITSASKFMVGRSCLNCHASIHGSNGLQTAGGCTFRE
jgi:DmsE family decaheme c-type cytochrome